MHCITHLQAVLGLRAQTLRRPANIQDDIFARAESSMTHASALVRALMGAHRDFYCDGLQATNRQLTGCQTAEGQPGHTNRAWSRVPVTSMRERLGV